MFASILPAYIRVVTAEEWMWNTPVAAEEEVVIQRAVEKRRREFRAGRHAAKRALSALEIHRFLLLPGKGREPLWPEGVVGALTHTGNYCAVAVASQKHCAGIGIDAEQCSPLKDELKPMICTPHELEWVAAQEAQGLHWVSKLLFSAKESIHKIYYPLNTYTLDFLDAELSVDIDQHTFSARIIKPYASARVAIVELTGKFAVDQQNVYTAIHLQQG